MSPAFGCWQRDRVFRRRSLETEHLNPTAEGDIMVFARISEVEAPDDHVVTAKEALESLYLRLEQEVEVRMVAAALRAGWSAGEALDAIDELRRDDIEASSGH
jgi:hypothetical protein